MSVRSAIHLSWIPMLLLLPGFFLQSVPSQVSADITQVTAVIQDRAELPCDLTPPIPDDGVALVLWYKDGSGSPIYSLDLRDRSLDAAVHFQNPDLQNRALLSTVRSSSFLQLQPVEEKDEGLFRCRVDFQKSPTRNQQVNLTVIVPPKEAIVVDETGQEVPSVLNTAEGSKLILSCEAIGGKPLPKVTWWKGVTLMDNTYEISASGVVRNDLILPVLTRNDLHMNLTCQASNSNLTVPASKTITIDLYLRPLDVRILGNRDPLSAEKHYELSCQSSGSRPPPNIIWLKQSSKFKHSKETVSSDGNVTTSALSFVPLAKDNGKYITCRVENPRIPGAVLEDGWKLDVYYKPEAKLELGSSLKKDNLKEGDDVYFECTIKANPRAYSVEWQFEGRFLNHNISAGIIISNQSLVLQKVRRTSAGAYTCIARNVEGDGISNPVQLKIKHAPVCRSGQKTVYGVARHEAAKIICEVDAIPASVSFKWTFNDTSKHLDVPRERFTDDGLRSIVTYVPRAEYDYGVLYCWGRNEIGQQREPCAFTIIAAGPPDVVQNCTIQNQTEESLHVECAEGFDGGMPQHFIMEVRDSVTSQLRSNVSNSVPVFHVSGLDSGTGFIITIYAANAKGRSSILEMAATTLRVAERRTSSPALFTITPILGVLIGVVAALVLVAIIIVIVMRLRGPEEEKKKEVDGESIEKTSTPLKHKEMDDADSSDEKNPDVVPNEEDTVYADVDDKTDQKLNNISNRIYENVHHPHTPILHPGDNAYENVNNIRNQHGKVKPVHRHEDITYAELQLPNNQRPMSTVGRINEPTVYAQIDHTRKAPSLHHPLEHEEDELPTAETPLMNNHRESTV